MFSSIFSLRSFRLRVAFEYLMLRKTRTQTVECASHSISLSPDRVMVEMEGFIYLELMIVADERGGEIGCRRVDRRLCWLNGIRPIVNRNWRTATLRRRCGESEIQFKDAYSTTP